MINRPQPMKTEPREIESADANGASRSHDAATAVASLQRSSNVSDAALPDMLPGALARIESLDWLADEAAQHNGNGETPTESAEPDSPAAQYAARYLASLSEIDADRLHLQPAFTPHADDNYHVRDLLRYHDRDFVANAYRAILKREPEAAEVTDATDALRHNLITKDDLIASLSSSEEGRASGVRVEGLPTPFVRRIKRQPAFTFVSQMVKGLFSVPRLIRDQQRFEAYTVGQQQIIAEHVNRLTHKLMQSETLAAAALAELAQSVADTGETLLLIADTLAGVAARQHEWRETSRQVAAQALSLSQASTRFVQLHAEVERQHRETQTRHADIVAQRRAQQEELLQHLNEMSRFRSDQNTELARLRLRVEETVSAHDEFLIQEQAVIVETQKLALAQMQQRLAEMTAQHARTHQALIEQQRNLQSLLTHDSTTSQIAADQSSDGAEAHTESVGLLKGAAVRDASNAQNSTTAIPFFDEMYAAFEERFRGSRELITERLREYLPRVRAVRERFDADAMLPVLDVGCGRGEWLELLREAGFAPRGVDSNRVTSAECQAHGLDVTHADVIAHLRTLEPNSVSLITGFHLIEHLPLHVLIELLDESLRVLAPGGAAIFETPNPKNLVVAACNFYSDPTHQSPVFPETIQFLLEQRGFVQVELEYMHTAPDNPFTGADRASEVLHGFLYGPLDYAVIGTKPA